MLHNLFKLPNTISTKSTDKNYKVQTFKSTGEKNYQLASISIQVLSIQVTRISTNQQTLSLESTSLQITDETTERQNTNKKEQNKTTITKNKPW